MEMSIHPAMRPVRRLVQCEGIVSLEMPCFPLKFSHKLFILTPYSKMKVLNDVNGDIDDDWQLRMHDVVTSQTGWAYYKTVTRLDCLFNRLTGPSRRLNETASLNRSITIT